MTPTNLIDLDEVRHALTARSVLDFYDHPTKRSGTRELQSNACPRRADHPRRAFTINIATGQWSCHPCGLGGDALRLVAEFERLSDRDDFPAVLARAAEIAGVGPSALTPEERSRRRAEYARVRARQDAEEQRIRAERERRAIPKATGYWNSLRSTHDRGLEYLAERDLARAAVLLRFDQYLSGSLAVPLLTSRGEIRNVVRRQLPELGEPKTWGLKDCPTAGTLLGSVTQIRADALTVITEGVADTLTAAIAWPGATVLGAHGAGNLATIVRVVAPHVRAAGTRLVLVPHNDKAGRAASIAAGKAAIDSGLSIRDGSLEILKHDEKDLNDTWRQGWRP